ncbi:MAG TPA: GAF domain-containing protein, partial [Anaerolineales bacterium]|nr:GAF domain-containing protein [Anaerolineales bacterium]
MISINRNLFFVTVYFTVDGDRLHLAHYSDPQSRDSQATVPRAAELSLHDIESHLKNGPLRVDLRDASTLPPSLVVYPHQLGCETAAYLPITQNRSLRGLLLIGARAGQDLNDDVINSFATTIQLTTNVLERRPSSPQPLDGRQSIEMNALNTLAANAATVNDLHAFYAAIHEQIRTVVGDYGIVIAIYDQKTNSINIPYLWEEGKFSSIDTFPLGEGLTSILIRTREALMLVEDTEKRSVAMGAKVAGRAAKSWLGVPMVARGEAIGAIIIQDLEQEHSFDDNDLRFVMAVANQISGALYNIRLLEESRRSALQFETAAEIARDISSSLNLDELLQKAVNLIRTRFHFYHAGVFLKDFTDEFIVIREATGEAGAQLKRASYKLAVGSKSVIGFVAGRGEVLVVNDTARDVTYHFNPLLPDTKSEAAIPLKIGERTVGVLDVQSQETYAFSEDNLRTLQILADQLAVAVVNTELFAETQEHLAQHRLLHHITTTAASGTTLEEALQSAVNGLQVTLGGD